VLGVVEGQAESVGGFGEVGLMGDLLGFVCCDLFGGAIGRAVATWWFVRLVFVNPITIGALPEAVRIKIA
jgi:hypothetical protein